MKKLIDIHNHTVASGHAYSSLQEMVQAAASAGIEYFGITDADLIEKLSNIKIETIEGLNFIVIK